uniref:Uncharacterized protein n=1 Tax=Triticum urartu TaxID=4572 RepID=A0A8R7VD92_TRIUA
FNLLRPSLLWTASCYMATQDEDHQLTVHCTGCRLDHKTRNKSSLN